MKESGIFIIIGIIFVFIGILWNSGIKIGNLPGDIVIDKGNFKFYFPLMSSIIISLILSMAYLAYLYFIK